MSAYMFEKAYKIICLGEEPITLNEKLSKRMEMLLSFFKSIKKDAENKIPSFSLDSHNVHSYYLLDDNDIQRSFVKCSLCITVNLEKP